MTGDDAMNEERTVVRDTAPAPGAPLGQRTYVDETVRRSPSGAEYARRLVVFVFGIIQLLLALRIILLLVAADRANALVKVIYDISGVLEAPFEGILRTDALKSGGTVLDVSAVVAIIGWTVLELIIVAGIGIARREA
jgi:YGGT family protein